MRLFEATGVGALLITDHKDNMREMFTLDEEVIVYRSTDECVEVIQQYLDDDQKRQMIAQSGQKRTLNDHSYEERMKELITIVKKYL